jgi:riboflavin synthase
MFTGIITDIGEVDKIDAGRADRRIFIKSSFKPASIANGSSIACSGCCLTVIGHEKDTFAVDVSAETLSKTTIGQWQAGTRINLERSLKAGDEMGGHIVSGHVDGIATLVTNLPEGGSRRMRFSFPEHLSRYVAVKGSVALGGVSLTVNNAGGNFLEVNMIPYTLENTTFGDIKEGEDINIEVDLLARYVARIIDKGGANAVSLEI